MRASALLAAGLLAGCFTGALPERGATDDQATTAATPLASLPLSRLTRAQYASTLHDLFGDLADDVSLPPADSSVDGYDDNVIAQAPSAALVEAYQAAADALAAKALAEPTELLQCTPTDRAAEDACAQSFFARFGRRVYRRPLAADDLAALGAFYGSLRAGGTDFVAAMKLSLQGMLQTPDFLYRIEAGTADGAGTVRLGGYEMASRLSYVLWGTMPDEALFAAAESGSLDDAAGVEAAARRLLADPKAHDGMRAFYRQWLHFSLLDQLNKDAARFPTFDADVAASMRAALDQRVERAFFGGTLTQLLTEPGAYVDAKLAPLYGIASPGEALAWSGLDPTQRAGLLTDVGLLAALAHDTEPAPVLRGVFVLDRLICKPPPPPPPGVPGVPEASATEPKTGRERFQQQHEQGTCKGCHASIDGIGFGFEHYDAVGQWRAEDAQEPVDATGKLVVAGDLDGPYDGAVELSGKLAASHTVHSCVAAQWLRYALGVDAASVDAAALEPVVGQFEASGLSLGELVVSFVRSDLFRTRKVQ